MLSLGVPATASTELLADGNILVLGSSECGGYVRHGQLAAKLEAIGRNPIVACSGARPTEWGTEAVRMIDDVPSTVLITLGLNRSPTFANDIRVLVEELRERGAEKIIWYTTNAMNNYYLPYNEILVQVGAEVGIEVVRWDQIGTGLSDNVHYSYEGYQSFADHLIESATGLAAPAVAGTGPCVLVSASASTQFVADYLAISTDEVLEANPWWGVGWTYGGVVCRAVQPADPPVSLVSGTEGGISGVSYEPDSGTVGLLRPWGLTDGLKVVGASRQEMFSAALLGAELMWAGALTPGDSLDLMLYDADLGSFEFRYDIEDGGGSSVLMRGTRGWSLIPFGDYDGDGEMDVLFYRANDGLMRFYSFGGGVFSAMTPIMFGNRGWTHIVPGDFNGDGADDVLFYRHTDGLGRLYEIGSGGVFRAISPVYHFTPGWDVIVAGPLVGPIKDSILWYRALDGKSRLYGLDPERGLVVESPVFNLPAGWWSAQAAHLSEVGEGVLAIDAYDLQALGLSNEGVGFQFERVRHFRPILISGIGDR